MDIYSTRAHACQILSTAEALTSELTVYLVLPKYHRVVDLDLVKTNHDLQKMPKLIFLHNFGLRRSGLLSFALFNIPATLFVIRKKLKGEKFFLYFRTGYFVPLAILSRFLGIPVFYETHRRPISWSERCRDHLMSKLARGFVVISSYMGEHYLPYRKGVLVAHDAVSLKRFVTTISREEARKTLNFGTDQKICVYAGTISRLKGIEYVIAAARVLPETTFLLVGSVSREFVGTILPPNVKLFGRVEQKDLPLILRVADVLLLPHPRGEYSQSPMKLFEYMTSGVPIVASRLPSIMEILNDENSVLVEAESVELMARGIQSLISNSQYSKTLSERAFLDVQNYTWEKRGVVVAEFIKQTLQIKNKKLSLNHNDRIRRIVLLARCLTRVILHGKANRSPVTISRVIVVPSGKLGDVVCCTPMFRAIRAHLPKAHIIVAGNSKLHRPLLADSALVDEYLDLGEGYAIARVKKFRVEVALISGPSYESTAIMCAAGIPLVVAPIVVGGFSPSETRLYKILQRFIKTFPYHIEEYAPRERLRALESIGIFSDDSKKKLGFSKTAEEKVKKFFVDNNINLEKDFIVGISPTAGNKIKEWPVDRFATVANYAVEKYKAKVVVMGGKGDVGKSKEMFNCLNKKINIYDTTGKFNLDELKAFISKLSLFISVDTGPIYIAEAFGIPTVNIVGPVDERVQPPRGLIHQNVVPPHRVKPELSILNARSYNKEEALRQVLSTSVPLVLKAIDKLISDISKAHFSY